MDEIEQRLKETSEQCIRSYEVWRKDKKSSQGREALQEAIHEVRKVASRLEIELALSERDEMAQKPIPIPPHRDARRRNQEEEGQPGTYQGGGNAQPRPQKRRGPPRKSAAGEAPRG